MSVCPSVCPLHAGIVSKQLYLSSKFFHLRVAPAILVFPPQTGWQCSDGDPSNGGIECKGVWKNHNFGRISRFISQMMRDRAIGTMEGE